MKLTLGQLKTFLRENEAIVKKKKKRDDNSDEEEYDIKDKESDLLLADVLSEAKTRLSESSVDDQIDALLIGFEQDSTNDDEFKTQYESSNFVNYAKLILEAEEEEEEDDGEEPLNVSSSEDISMERPADPQTPLINIDEFASKVSRLILNRDNLLDVKTVIYNRAVKFVEQNYDKEIASSLEDILENEHGIEKEKDYHNKPPANYAVGAGPNIGG